MKKNVTVAERAVLPIFIFTLASFAIAGIILTARLISTAVSASTAHTDYTGYILSLLQCVLGIISVFIPNFLQKRYGFRFSAPLRIAYLAFLYCAIFLGEVKNYYITVPLWDDILHGFSGVMAGLFAFMVIAVITVNTNDSSPALPPLLIALFAFVFSVAIGAIWEIYEFAMDGFLELNMQKYRESNGTPLIGREALFDTMKDIVVDTIGALAVAVWGYVSMKTNWRWLSKYSKTRKVRKA